MSPPDLLLWLVVIVTLGPTAMVGILYALAGTVVGILTVIDKVTP